MNAGWACLWGSHLTPAVLGVQGGQLRAGAAFCIPLCTHTSPVPLGLESGPTKTSSLLLLEFIYDHSCSNKKKP